MAENANLKTDITANNADFMRKIAESKAAVSGFQSQIASMATALKTGFALIGVSTIVNGFKNVYENIDKTIASANKLDIGVRNFQALSFAAKRSDVEIGTLEAGLKKLRQTISSAKPGDSIAGVSTDKLKTMELNEAYLAIADSISKMKDSYLQAQAAKEAFGKAGQEQLNLIRNNPRGFVDQFIKSGKGLSDDDVRKFNELDKAADELASSVGNNLQQAFISLGPAILGATQAFSAMAAAGGKVTSGLSQEIGEYATQIRGLVKGEYDPNAPFSTEDQVAMARRRRLGMMPSSIPGMMEGSTVDKTPVIEVGKELNVLASAAAAASAAFKAITPTLDNLLGLDKGNLGKDYIAQNLPAGMKQATSEEFNSDLKALRDYKAAGASQATIDQQIKILKGDANRLGGYEGLDAKGNPIYSTNSGALAAVSDFENANKMDRTIDVKLKVEIDKNGILHVFQEGGAGKAVLENAVKKVTATEAAAVRS